MDCIWYQDGECAIDEEECGNEASPEDCDWYEEDVLEEAV